MSIIGSIDSIESLDTSLDSNTGSIDSNLDWEIHGGIVDSKWDPFSDAKFSLDKSSTSVRGVLDG